MNQSVPHLNSRIDNGLRNSVFMENCPSFIPAILLLYQPESGKVSFLNDRLKDVLGFTAQEIEVMGFVYMDLVYADDLDVVAAELRKIRELPKERTHTFTARFNHKDGGCKYLKNFCTRTEDAVVFFIENVTEQVKFQEEANAARQLFDETEKLLLFGSWTWSLKNDKVDWTEGMLDLLEYDQLNQEHATIQYFLKHVLPEHADHLRQVLTSSIQERKPFETEFVIKTGKGKEKFVFMKGKPLFDKEGNVKKMVGITRDITSVKNFENERDRNIRELNRSNKELEEFAYVASHDLHEPLRKILTFSERLKERYASVGDDAKVYVDRIWASANSMRNLIDNLLEFSKITRSSRLFVQCDLNKILGEVQSDQELRIEETSTDINIQDLPVVDGVPSELKQLFNNLIGNALKFRKKDVQPVIKIVCKKLSHKEKSDLLLPFNQVFYEIKIQDNGIGFESIYAEKIFEIFQRLHGKTEYSGSGIGLAICKKIVDNHDGIIYATSEPGKGSTFSVILPEKQH
jgi:PAS domain S-box-containing protein